MDDLLALSYAEQSPLRQWRQRLAFALDNACDSPGGQEPAVASSSGGARPPEDSPQHGAVETRRSWRHRTSVEEDFIGDVVPELAPDDQVKQPLPDSWSALPVAYSEVVQEKVKNEESFLLGSLRAEGRLERMLRDRCSSAERRAEQKAEQAWCNCRDEWQKVKARRDEAMQHVEDVIQRLSKARARRNVQTEDIAELRRQVEDNAARWNEERACMRRERSELEEQCLAWDEVEEARKHAKQEWHQELEEARVTVREAIAEARARAEEKAAEREAMKRADESPPMAQRESILMSASSSTWEPPDSLTRRSTRSSVWEPSDSPTRRTIRTSVWEPPDSLTRRSSVMTSDSVTENPDLDSKYSHEDPFPSRTLTRATLMHVPQNQDFHSRTTLMSSMSSVSSHAYGAGRLTVAGRPDNGMFAVGNGPESRGSRSGSPKSQNQGSSNAGSPTSQRRLRVQLNLGPDTSSYPMSY